MLHITPRERDLLRLLGAGATAAGIAQHLEVSASDVESFVRTLMTRMGATSEADLVTVARRRGLLDGYAAAS